MSHVRLITAYVGLGSNLGDRAGNLSRARDALAGLGKVAATSSMYETAPWGVDEPQPAYFNQVVVLETGLQAGELIKRFLEIEAQSGRQRTRPGSSRVIDIDLLLYGDTAIDEPGVTVPHPRMHLRAFVLVPLAEIAAGATVPGLGRTVRELAKETGSAGVRRMHGVTDRMEGGG